MYKVLLVDDDEKDLEGVINNINWIDYGMEICGTARNGMQGLSMAIDQVPDIIISDIAMPVMNGLDMVKEYKKIHPDVTVILMTCFQEFDFAKSAINLNANAYILKPICLEELSACLASIAKIKLKELNDKIYRSNLEQTITEAMPLLQKEFYQNLLLGRIISGQELKEKQEFLGISSDVKQLSCMHIEIDNYGVKYGDYSSKDKYLLIEKVLLCVEELLIKSEGRHAVKIDDKSLAVVIFSSRKCENALIDNITLAKFLKDNIASLVQVEVTIGVSGIVDNVRDLSEQYVLARKITNSKFYTSGNCVLLTADYVENDEALQYDYNDIKSSVSDYFTGKDKTRFLAILDQYYSSGVAYSRNHLKLLSYTIINILQGFLLERNLNFHCIFGNELVVWEKLSKFETILDIRKWMENIVIAAEEALNQREQSRLQSIAEDIGSYINEYYAEIANVAQVADHFEISVSYANAVFKAQKGITIFEYLVERKMAAAREMLQNPYCRINEIASSLGYMTPAYFTSVFKLRHNMTPKEYRKKFGTRRT